MNLEAPILFTARGGFKIIDSIVRSGGAHGYRQWHRNWLLTVGAL